MDGSSTSRFAASSGPPHPGVPSQIGFGIPSKKIPDLDPQGRPKKIDIDTMHSYRDSIRGGGGERIVRYAAILYPGQTITYTAGLAALRAQPEDPQSLEESVRSVLLPALTLKSDVPVDPRVVRVSARDSCSRSRDAPLFLIRRLT